MGKLKSDPIPTGLATENPPTTQRKAIKQHASCMKPKWMSSHRQRQAIAINEQVVLAARPPAVTRVGSGEKTPFFAGTREESSAARSQLMRPQAQLLMQDASWQEKLLNEPRDFITDEEARAAFDPFVQVAEQLRAAVWLAWCHLSVARLVSALERPTALPLTRVGPALDMEHSGLTAASLRVRFIPCVISDHEHARAIGRVAGADIVMWGQTFCNWRKPGPCQFVELHLEGANRSNTIRGSPHASLVNNVGIHSAPDTAAETEFTTSLTVVRWVGLEADGTADEPVWGGRQLAGAELPQLTSPRTKLLIDFVLGLYAYRAGRHGLAAEFFQRSQASVAVAGIQGLPELYRMMGTSYVISGRTEDGLQALKKGNDSCQPDQISCRALGLSSLGWAMNRLGQPREALAYFDRSLALDRQQGNRAAEAATLNNLGLVYQKLGDRKTALALCQSALPLARQANCRHDEATMLDSLGSLHDAAGDTKKAAILNTSWLSAGSRLPRHLDSREATI